MNVIVLILGLFLVCKTNRKRYKQANNNTLDTHVQSQTDSKDWVETGNDQRGKTRQAPTNAIQTGEVGKG